ncbi:MAG: hypothetical protein ACUVQG_10515 [Thermogutta sp.]
MAVCRLMTTSLIGLGLLAVSGYPQVEAYDCPTCGTCQANVQFFGHYPTRWRPWPGESRPDIHFPQSIGAEPTKRPAGESIPELPKEILQPVVPRPQQFLPESSPAEAMPEPQPGPFLPPSAPMPPVSPGLDTTVPSQTKSSTELPPPQSAPMSLPPAAGLPSAPVPQPQGEPSDLPSPMPPLPESPQPVPPAAPSPNILPSGNPGTSTIRPGSGFPISRRNSSPLPPWMSPSPQATAAQASVPWGGTPGVTAGAGTVVTSQLGPLTITNPTIASASPAVTGQSTSTPQNKFEVSRSEFLPDLAAAPWLPSVRDGNTMPAMAMAATGPAGSASENVVINPAPSRPGAVSTPAVTVWAEDLPETQVAPANFSEFPGRTVPGLSDSKGGVIPAAATEVSPGLGGYCPVELVENESWVKGEARFAVEHQGKTYFCAGATQRRKFQTNPERYVPVYNGSDPVLLADQGVRSDGRIEHCVVYDGRLYMFSSAASLARFRQNPQHYARIATQVMP